MRLAIQTFSVFTTILLGTVGLVNASATAQSTAGTINSQATYKIGFAPFIGGGKTSDQSSVRHISGYTVALERNFRPASQALPKLVVAPRFELTNSFVNTRDSRSSTADQNLDEKITSTYDNRIFAAGLSIGHAVGNSGTFAQGAYLTAMAGKGYTKLSVDETSDTRYRQLQWGGLSGNYFGSEVGAWIPLQKNFGINLAVLGSIYQAKLPDSQPTQDGEEDVDGESIALRGSVDRNDTNVSETIYLKTLAVKCGVSLEF